MRGYLSVCVKLSPSRLFPIELRVHITDLQAVGRKTLVVFDLDGTLALTKAPMDEEMTDLTRFQKAFQASARLVTTVDEMLDTLVNMKR